MAVQGRKEVDLVGKDDKDKKQSLLVLQAQWQVTFCHHNWYMKVKYLISFHKLPFLVTGM